MLIIISVIVLCIIGKILMCIDDYYFGNDGLFYTGVFLFITNICILIVLILLLIVKPLIYENFIVKYETLKETITASNDIRDTNYTQKLIEINEEINTNKRFINNKWIGIFCSKKVAELELVSKEENK